MRWSGIVMGGVQPELAERRRRSGAGGHDRLASCRNRPSLHLSRRCSRRWSRSSTAIGRGASGSSSRTTIREREPRCCAYWIMSSGMAIETRSPPPRRSANGSHRLPATGLPPPGASGSRQASSRGRKANRPHPPGGESRHLRPHGWRRSVQGSVDQLQAALTAGTLRFHRGRIGGVYPRLAMRRPV